MTIPQTEIKLAKLNNAIDDLRKSHIIAAIRAKYDVNDEMAILRQKDTKPDEYATYNAYIEQIKDEIDRQINAVTVKVK